MGLRYEALGQQNKLVLSTMGIVRPGKCDFCFIVQFLAGSCLIIVFMHDYIETDRKASSERAPFSMLHTSKKDTSCHIAWGNDS